MKQKLLDLASEKQKENSKMKQKLLDPAKKKGFITNLSK